MRARGAVCSHAARNQTIPDLAGNNPSLPQPTRHTGHMASCTVGKYKILGKVGEGSFSDVVKCQDRQTGDLFAAKRLKKIRETIDEVLQTPEVLVMRKLKEHPNILRMFESHFDPLPGRVTIIFELMDMSLYDLMKTRKRCVPETRVKNYLYQILKALEHLHSHGLFHRDIKPENILLKVSRMFGQNEIIKLADFGSVRGIYSRPPYTEYISTRWYRSPECLLTSGFYGPKMDIWATGCVYFELLTAGNGLNCQLANVSEAGREILQQMLIYDPDTRAHSRRLLEHRYFNDLRELESSPRHRSCATNTSAQPLQLRRNPALTSVLLADRRQRVKGRRSRLNEGAQPHPCAQPHIALLRPQRTKKVFEEPPRDVGITLTHPVLQPVPITNHVLHIPCPRKPVKRHISDKQRELEKMWGTHMDTPPAKVRSGKPRKLVPIQREVVLRVSHSSLMSSDRMKPRSGDWAVTIDFLQESTITSLSSGSNEVCQPMERVHLPSLPEECRQLPRRHQHNHDAMSIGDRQSYRPSLGYRPVRQLRGPSTIPSLPTIEPYARPKKTTISASFLKLPPIVNKRPEPFEAKWQPFSHFNSSRNIDPSGLNPDHFKSCNVPMHHILNPIPPSKTIPKKPVHHILKPLSPSKTIPKRYYTFLGNKL
uniref:Protein kinase domain-containing protein n=1 Tax=Timema tahoe TaxID=61484 RepID=A0A7R9IDE3_9NEOP|nr:unnamed protein product [Timema tahoe]